MIGVLGLWSTKSRWGAGWNAGRVVGTLQCRRGVSCEVICLYDHQFTLAMV